MKKNLPYIKITCYNCGDMYNIDIMLKKETKYFCIDCIKNEILELRGVDIYNSLNDAEKDWDNLEDLDNINKEDYLILINKDLFDDTQIIKVKNKYYFWYSKNLYDNL